MSLPTKRQHFVKGAMAIVCGVVVGYLGKVIGVDTLMWPWIMIGIGIVFWGLRLWYLGITTKENIMICPSCGHKNKILVTAENYFCQGCKRDISLKTDEERSQDEDQLLD